MNVFEFASEQKFLMLALDHRDSFRKMLNPVSPTAVLDEEITALKSQIINSVKDEMSGFLIDSDHEGAAFRGAGKPFLLPIEKSGYEDTADGRINTIEYSVSDLKNKGASGIKLLLYVNPTNQVFDKQLETGKKILEECKKEDAPLFLEFVTYGEKEGTLKTKLIVETIQKFISSGVIPDVFKLEYPGDIEGCRELNKVVGDKPWILLTRGEPFELFKRHLQDAVIEGASGFLAGRALFQELGSLSEAERSNFISQIIPSRFHEIAEIVRNNSFMV